MYIIASLAFVMSALTIPMSFLSTVIEETAEYKTITSKLIRFIWCWSIDIINGTNLSEAWAALLLHVINFSVFFFVLFLGYRVYLLIRKLV